MKDFNIFKIEYHWYEGEHEETLLVKEIEPEKFEEDLMEAKKFAESLIGIEIKDYDYLGKGYSTECLPEFYEQILWYLTNKLGYIYCNHDNHKILFLHNERTQQPLRRAYKPPSKENGQQVRPLAFWLGWKS